jgi:hypothetical protein
MRTTETVEAVVEVRTPYIGNTMARSATEAHCEKRGITAAGPVRPDQLETLLGKLGGGLNIFLDREKSLPLVLLLRIALRLRGGRTGEVWLRLLTGVVFLCAGDICFAYFRSLGEEHLGPFVHATFILGYALIAGGAHRQLRILQY